MQKEKNNNSNNIQTKPNQNSTQQNNEIVKLTTTHSWSEILHMAQHRRFFFMLRHLKCVSVCVCISLFLYLTRNFL